MFIIPIGYGGDFNRLKVAVADRADDRHVHRVAFKNDA